MAGDWFPFYLLALVGLLFAAVIGSIDALTQPRKLWAMAGFRRNRWIWQFAALPVVPAALVYSGVYFFRVRPRLTAADRALAWVEFPTPAQYGTPPADAVVRLRMPWSALLLMLAPGFSPLTIQAVLQLASPYRRPHFWWQLGLAWLVLLVVAVLFNLLFGITLTADEAIVRGFRRRHYAWNQITAVTQERDLGSRRIRIWTADGRSQRLRAPMVPGFNLGRQRFDRDFHLIGQWWLAHRPASAGS